MLLSSVSTDWHGVWAAPYSNWVSFTFYLSHSYPLVWQMMNVLFFYFWFNLSAPLTSTPVWTREFASSEELIAEFCRECRIVRKGTFCFCFFPLCVCGLLHYHKWFCCCLLRTCWWFEESNERWETHYHWGIIIISFVKSFLFQLFSYINIWLWIIILTGKTFRSKHILNDRWEQISIKWSRQE